jgi:hypothetical protein
VQPMAVGLQQPPVTLPVRSATALHQFATLGSSASSVGNTAPELGRAVDKWAEHQEDQPTRSEAIHRLVEIGLEAKK